MNIGKFLFRLALFISGLWGCLFYVGIVAQQEMGADQYYIFFGGLIFVWLCFWVIMGLAKD